eukprot:987569-Pleurochrysis_carterae.AAC.2
MQIQIRGDQIYCARAQLARGCAWREGGPACSLGAVRTASVRACGRSCDMARRDGLQHSTGCAPRLRTKTTLRRVYAARGGARIYAGGYECLVQSSCKQFTYTPAGCPKFSLMNAPTLVVN